MTSCWAWASSFAAGLHCCPALQIELESEKPRFFIFIFFIFIFTKIYFCFQNLQEYTTAAPLPGGRDLVAPLQGGRGFSAKNFAENLR